MRTLLLLIAAIPAWATIGSHPRIWVNSTLVTLWQQKACLNPMGVIPACTPDPDWAAIKTDADGYVASSTLLPSWTVTSITNANPAVFTVSGTMPTWTAYQICFGGATGNWAAINNANTESCHVGVTRLSATTFSVSNINSTAFGTSAGHISNLVMLFDSNTGSGYTTAVYTVDPDGSNGSSGSTNGFYRGSGWFTFVTEMYIVWQVTGNVAYVAPVLAWLDYINTLAPQSVTAMMEPSNYSDGYASRNVGPALALAFDWFYSQLSSGQKTATAVTANAWYDVLATAYESPEGCKGASDCGYDFSQGNFWGGHILAGGLLGYATYGDNSRDSGGSNPLIDDTRTYFNSFFVVSATGPTGSWSGGQLLESYNYGPNHAYRLLQYTLAIKTSTGEDLTAYANTILTNQLYNLGPERWKATTEGTFPGNTVGVMPGILFNFVSYLLSGSTNGAYAEFAWSNFASCPPAPSTCISLETNGPLLILDKFFWYDPTATATDYRNTLPTYYVSQGDWHLFSRTDWTDSAIWASFNGSPQNVIDHQNRAAGNIDIKRGADYLLVTASEYADNNGTTGSPSTGQSQSDLNNTLWFCDGGVYSFCNSASYTGGQMFWAPYVAARAKATANYTFETADLTYAYDVKNPIPANRTVRYYFRAFCFFGDGTMVVQDLTKVKLSSYTQKIRWNLNPTDGAPTNTSGVVTQSVGTSRIYIAPVLPASPSITITQGSGTSGATNTYQVDVTNASAATDQNMLTVIYPAAKATSFPTTTAISTIAANWMGVEVKDASPKVAVLPYAVTDNGNNTYTPNTYSSTTFTSTHSGTGKYLVAGLTAGTYAVTGPCVSNCSGQVVGADGTLFFTGTAGAFSIGNGGGGGTTSKNGTISGNVVVQ